MKTIIITTLLLITLVNKVHSQIYANFSSQTVKGCSPLVINFNNLSNSSTNTFYEWDLGNGTFSDEFEPSTIYTNTGTYDVKLIIRDGLNTDTIIKKNYIEVFADPQPKFTITELPIGCAPYSVNFIDESLGIDTTILSWQWDFGDGSISESSNPEHTYTFQNNYNISLQITDKNYCSNSIKYENFVQVYKPEADFTSTDTKSCSGTLNCTLNYLPEETKNLTFLWDFGNGTFSNQINPSAYYSNPGIYSIKLTVTDKVGCTANLTKKNFITITKLTSLFKLEDDTFCVNENIKFQNLSKLASSYLWDFGDSTTSVLINPVHKYSKPGNYSISLISSNEQGCSETYIYKIVIEKIVADFSLSEVYKCQVPAIVKYIDKSENAVSWKWGFGNNLISTEQNPENIFTQKGDFYDTLTVTGPHGCTDKKIHSSGLSIILPKAYFTPNYLSSGKVAGCVPLDLDFKDGSTYLSDVDQITDYMWTFENNTHSCEKNPSHIFGNIGIFDATLQIKTSLGCTAEFSSIIKVGTPQKASFTSNAKKTICASETVEFVNTSTDQNLINGYQWDFGDGQIRSGKNPAHLFVDTGYMNVKLTVYYNGCPASNIVLNYLYVKGPYTNLDYSVKCEKRFDAIFNETIIDAEHINWNFGDFTSGADIEKPVHTYPERGSYMVELSTSNSKNNCSFVSKSIITITDIKSEFEADKIIGCTDLDVIFNSSNSNDANPFNYAGNSRRYLWDFGDNTAKTHTEEPEISHLFKTKGAHKVSLIVKDFRSCADTMTLQVKIYKPEPEISKKTSTNCLPLTVDFQNLTKTDTTIVFWEWDFGNGNISNEQIPTEIYRQYGVYNVKLKATDIIGCTGFISKDKYIKAVKPNPDFISEDSTICINQNIQFNFLTKDSLVSHFWDFGDGIQSTEVSPFHTYKDSGTYNVSLYLRDIQGCDSAKTVNSFISVQSPPIVDFEADTLYANCFPLIVTFKDKTIHPNKAEWFWGFGDSQSSMLQNPIHTYTKPGLYEVSLKSSSTNGCSSELVKESYIEIGGPYADILVPDTICRNINTIFIADKIRNSVSSTWFFDDGNKGFGDTVFHKYKKVGYVHPLLLLKSDTIHTCDKYFSDTVFVHHLDAEIYIDTNNVSGCIPFIAEFCDSSKNTTSRIWTSGTGETKYDSESYFLYKEPGEYELSLFVFDNSTCTDTAHYKLHALPLPNISIKGDTVVCRGDNYQLEASGALEYKWFPKDFLDNDTIYNPVASPEETFTYSVIGKDENNCENNATTTLFVQQVPIISIPDTSIVIGETVILDATSEEIGDYTWIPDFNLACPTCPIITVMPLENTIFTISVTDTNNCFTVSKDITIEIMKKYSIDVPAAFTPNNDGINDVVYVRGWGIKKLINFSIYNRFGELVFRTDNINTGWDGSYKGKSQVVETYTYSAEVLTYGNQILQKTGHIKLLH